jgi:hypothetical protein
MHVEEIFVRLKRRKHASPEKCEYLVFLDFVTHPFQSFCTNPNSEQISMC